MPQGDDRLTAGAPEPFTAASFPASPDLECDIVMKGGITSGVIYPLAVCELAQTYRLHSVGGASAGAIAAAAAAAAEVGRASLAAGIEGAAGSPGRCRPVSSVSRSFRRCSPKIRRTGGRCSSICSGRSPRQGDSLSC